jgi:hypothetical protein
MLEEVLVEVRQFEDSSMSGAWCSVSHSMSASCVCMCMRVYACVCVCVRVCACVCVCVCVPVSETLVARPNTDLFGIGIFAMVYGGMHSH